VGSIASKVEEKEVKRFFALSLLGLVLWVLYGVGIYAHEYLWMKYAKIRMGWV
jgi:hypothetical protein